ncbi:MAG: hypothetical protein M5U34_23075 [Chloroflexi bacterium]|nr:hypothetical protein [Chloroflexota bacterium]
MVAAAVILPLHNPDALAQLYEVNDSKQLSAKTRERLFSPHHPTRPGLVVLGKNQPK